MNLNDLAEAISSPQKVVDFCQKHRLIAQLKMCTNCGESCKIATRCKLQDQYSWRCVNTMCRRWISIRRGTFFEQSRLDIGRILKLIYLWSNDLANLQSARRECRILSSATFFEWKNFLRELCRRHFLRNGGLGLPHFDIIASTDEECETTKRNLLAEFMWKEKFRKNPFVSILAEIAEEYPV